MAYDIYGNHLLPGHCEVHPHVHEEYPCSICLSENNKQTQQRIREEQPIEERVYTLQEVRDIVMKFCEWEVSNYQAFSHPPYLTDRWRAFCESNL